jgi:hypothetical protein
MFFGILFIRSFVRPPTPPNHHRWANSCYFLVSSFLFFFVIIIIIIIFLAHIYTSLILRIKKKNAISVCVLVGKIFFFPSSFILVLICKIERTKRQNDDYISTRPLAENRRHNVFRLSKHIISHLIILCCCFFFR